MCYCMNVKEGDAKLPGKVNDVVTAGKLLAYIYVLISVNFCKD